MLGVPSLPSQHCWLADLTPGCQGTPSILCRGMPIKIFTRPTPLTPIYRPPPPAPPRLFTPSAYDTRRRGGGGGRGEAYYILCHKAHRDLAATLCLGHFRTANCNNFIYTQLPKFRQDGFLFFLYFVLI